VRPPTLNPPLCTLNPQLSTLHPPPSTLNLPPSTLNPQLFTLHPPPSTLNPQLSTLHPQHSTLNHQPSTLHPPPSTPHPPSSAFAHPLSCAPDISIRDLSVNPERGSARPTLPRPWIVLSALLARILYLKTNVESWDRFDVPPICTRGLPVPGSASLGLTARFQSKNC